MDGDWSGPPGVGWGLCVRDTASGKVLTAIDADRVFATASIGKVLLLAEVARRFEAGELEPLEPLTRKPEDAVADSGLWQHLRTDTLPAADLAALVGAVSDNLATNVLVRRVGLEPVAALARGDAASPAVSAQVLDWLALDTDLSMVASAFGLDPLAHVDADRAVLLRHKTGTNTGVRADAGVVGPFAYAVLANWDDAAADRRDEVLARMAAIGRTLRDAL